MNLEPYGLLTLAYYFNPGGPAIGALRPFRFHRYLKTLGYESRVVTAHPPRQYDPAEIEVAPDCASLYWDQRAAALRSNETVPRMPLEAYVELALRKTLFESQAVLTWARAARTAGAKVLRRDNGITHVMSTSPPISAHIAALRLARQFGLSWIADFRDPIGQGPTALSQWALRSLERSVFRSADAIVANTETAASRWRQLFPHAASKIHVIWNGFDPADQVSALPLPPRVERVLVHAGSLYGGRHANAIINGLASLRREEALARSVRIVLAGPVSNNSGLDEAAYTSAVEEGWLQMNRASVPRPEAQQLTCTADGLLLLQPQSRDQVPAKLFEYLSIGRPILAFIPRESAIEWILVNAGVPFVIIYADDLPQAVSGKLRQYLRLPSTVAAPNDWYRTTFDAGSQTNQLAALIDATPPPKKARRSQQYLDMFLKAPGPMIDVRRGRSDD